MSISMSQTTLYPSENQISWHQSKNEIFYNSSTEAYHIKVEENLSIRDRNFVPSTKPSMRSIEAVPHGSRSK